MNRFFIYFFFLFSIFDSFSQTFEIKGNVIDKQRKPIPFAHVMNLDDSLSVVCDVTGNFKITIDNKSIVLIIINNYK